MQNNNTHNSNDNNNSYDNTSNQNELLFWKVFKNIFLFKKIISFLYSTSIRYGIYKYDEIKNVDWMIKHKHFTILVKKIKDVEELSFYTNYALHRDNNSVKESQGAIHSSDVGSEFQGSLLNLKQYINNKIHESELNHWFDFEFYNLLFKNYKSNFTYCQNMVDTLVYFGNLNALKSIVETYKLSINQDHFYNAIQYSNFKVAKYIYDTLNSLKSTSSKLTSQSKIWEKSFKSTKSTTAKKVNERIDFLIGSLKFTIPKSMKSITMKTSDNPSTFKFKINEKIYEETLQFLIDSCFSLLVLGFKSNSFPTIWEIKKKRIEKSHMELKLELPGHISLLNSYLKESSKTSILTFDKLSEIKNQFTEIELSTKLFKFQLSLIDGTLQCSNQFLNNVQLLIKMLLPFFGKKTYILNHLYYLIMYKQDEIQETKLIYNETIDYFFQTFQEETFFFKYCIGRIDKQIEYLNSFVLVKGNGCRRALNKFKSLIHMDSDIRLITLVRKFINENCTIDQLNFEKSNNNYLLELSNQHLLVYIHSLNIVNFNLNILFPNRITILKWFKTNYPTQYQLEISKLDINLISQNLEYGCQQDAINFIIDNISDFLPMLINNHSQSFIDKIVNDREQLEIYLKFGNYKSIPLLSYYQGDLSGISIQYGKVYKFDILFDEIARKADLTSLDWIISNFNLQIITRFLLMSIHYNQYSIFQYMYNHNLYTQLFIPNTMEKQVFLNVLSKKALFCNHLDIIYFFKDIVKINSLAKFKHFNNFK